MLALEGIYQNGQLFLPQKVELTQPMKVIVTFLEAEKITHNEVTEKLVVELYANDNITFKQAQSLLNHQNWQDTVTVLELLETLYAQMEINVLCLKQKTWKIIEQRLPSKFQILF